MYVVPLSQNMSFLDKFTPCHHGPCRHGPCRHGPCRHGMARPQFADGGTASDMEGSCENILNKQSWTADKGWSSGLVVGRGVDKSSP
jgi:hypothetical protein